jgi:hypothetical protein
VVYIPYFLRETAEAVPSHSFYHILIAVLILHQIIHESDFHVQWHPFRHDIILKLYVFILLVACMVGSIIWAVKHNE